MQTKNIERRIENLEGDLGPEQVATIYRDIVDKLFNKEISTEEANKEIELFIERYVDPMDHYTWVKFMLKKGELDHCRWGYEYFKTYLECLDFKKAYLQMFLLLIESQQAHAEFKHALQDAIPEFTERWEKYCEEHPEDKYHEEDQEDRAKRFIELPVGELMIGLEVLEKQREEILNDDKLNEIWDELGYERLSSIFDIEEGQQRAERGDTSGKSEN
jgi:hypothetical protein